MKQMIARMPAMLAYDSSNHARQRALVEMLNSGCAYIRLPMSTIVHRVPALCQQLVIMLSGTFSRVAEAATVPQTKSFRICVLICVIAVTGNEFPRQRVDLARHYAMTVPTS
jgi:hypothetical protein